MRSIRQKLGFSELSVDDYLVQVKTITDGLIETDVKTKLVKFLPASDKVVISSTLNDVVFVENMSNYPLGREHEGLLRRETFIFSKTSTYNNMQELIDVAAFYANSMMALTGKIYVIKVYDTKFYSRTKTVIPNIFSTSRYLIRIPDVVLGNAENGALLASPEILQDINGIKPQDDGFLI